jgi:hypothetical protein
VAESKSSSTSVTSPTEEAKSQGRARSSSLVKVEEIKETVDDVLDQSVYPNLNQEWVNRKGRPSGGISFVIAIADISGRRLDDPSLSHHRRQTPV